MRRSAESAISYFLGSVHGGNELFWPLCSGSSALTGELTLMRFATFATRTDSISTNTRKTTVDLAILISRFDDTLWNYGSEINDDIRMTNPR